MRILLDSTLSPELCRVVAPVATMETLMESRVTIQLYDVLGDRYVLTDQGGMSVMEQLRGGLVKVLFTENENPLPKRFDYEAYKGRSQAPIQPKTDDKSEPKLKAESPKKASKGKKGKKGKKPVKASSPKKAPVPAPEPTPDNTEDEETKSEPYVDESLAFGTNSSN